MLDCPDARIGGATTTAPVCDLLVDGLSKSYGREADIFCDVSFTVARGEAVALIGANGAGKSTLLRSILGLVRPSSGRITLLDTEMSRASGAAMRRLRARTGLVAQRHNLVPRLSVLSNVLHGFLGLHSGPRYWSHTLAPQVARRTAVETLARVGLADLALRRADTLSGGQSQRVAIARALVAGPRLLIADEPCASLDPAAGEDVMELFFRLVREEGVTVLFSSHNVTHALTYGDRVLGLAAGRLRLDAPTADLEPSMLRSLYG